MRLKWERRVLALVVMTVLSGMTVSGSEDSPMILERDNLIARAKEYCAAWSKDDSRVSYELALPDLRRCVTYEVWSNESRQSKNDRVLSCKVTAAQSLGIGQVRAVTSMCSNDTIGFDAAAEVKVTVRVRSSEGTTKTFKDVSTRWIHIDGTWYWLDNGRVCQ
jgi:hypothetical protein